MKKRKDCFFGLHFDFHPNFDTTSIGKNFDGKLLNEIISKVKPDFVQCDAKGHNSCSSYKTEVGTPSPNLCCDLLAEWRKITAENDIPLYCHCSGLWAIGTSSQHPEWAARNADGSSTVKMSVFGNYVDELLIPQLKEIAGKYKLNGVWIDGECWAQVIDYSENAKKLFLEKTGIDVDNISESDWNLWLDFQREGFRNYVEHYVKEVKKEYPDFEITSNYLNTSWVPDYFNVTDYISGDLLPTNAVDCARFDGRLIQAFGRNWDMMSWGISSPVHHVKSAVQLEQEAAVIIALGGGFQVYNMQSPQNTVHDEWALPMWQELGSFMHARKELCFDKEQMCDIGIVYSAKAYYSCMNNAIFCRDNPYNNEFSGVLMSLCDTGRSVSVILAERFEEIDLSDYRLIVITDFDDIEDGVCEKLYQYAENGGNLLIIGAKAAQKFAGRVNATIKDGKNPIVMVKTERSSAELRCPYSCISGISAINMMEEWYAEGDLIHPDPPPTIAFANETPSLAVTSYNEGTVGFIPVSYGSVYLNDRTWELKNFVYKCVSSFGNGLASVNKRGTVELILRRNEDKIFINLINLQGEHRSSTIKTFEEIPSVFGIEVDVEMDTPPKAVKLQPENIELSYEKTQNGIRVSLEKLDIHGIIEITK